MLLAVLQRWGGAPSERVSGVRVQAGAWDQAEGPRGGSAWGGVGGDASPALASETCINQATETGNQVGQISLPDAVPGAGRLGKRRVGGAWTPREKGRLDPFRQILTGVCGWGGWKSGGGAVLVQG